MKPSIIAIQFDTQCMATYILTRGCCVEHGFFLSILLLDSTDGSVRGCMPVVRGY
jgi:hypothetical protein